MKFQVGDPVLLVHSQEEGTVVKILNREMVVVEVEGISFPVYVDQLDTPYFKRFSAPKAAPKARLLRGEEIPAEKPKPQPQRPDHGVFLSVVPVYESYQQEEYISVLKLYLISESTLKYRFRLRLYLNGQLDLELDQELAPFHHLYLKDLEFEQLNDFPLLEFRFNPLPEQVHLAPVLETSIKLKARQVLRKLESLEQRRDASFREQLFDRYPDREVPQTDTPAFKLPAAAQGLPSWKASQLPQAPYELDLHLEKLHPDHGHMSPQEMLDVQLRELERNLELAVVHRQASMVVIHGVGSGRLRDEVHEVLRRTPEVHYFVHQYHPRYGYGATEVFFRYPKPGPHAAVS